ncbi:hypothetical protein AAG906_029108 [Vitis piasezkii]
MGTLEIELLIGPITFPTLVQVKFIHDGQVIIVQSIGDMFISSEPVLHISHSDNDLFLTRFTFDEVQTLEMEDFCRDFLAMSFDQHGSTVVLDMMRSFMAIPDHDVPLRLGFIPTEVDYRYMARLRKERLQSHLDGIIGGLNTVQEVEPQRLVHQLQLSDGAPGTSVSALAVPSSPDRVSLMTLYFPDEVNEYRTFAEIGDIMDETIPLQPKLASPFNLFRVSAIEVAEEVQTAPTSKFSDDVIFVDDLLDGPVGPYLPVSCDITLSAPSSPTSQIFDIDDEIAQPDSNDDSSSASDSGPIDHGVSPAIGDTEVVDVGTVDQPRELKIRVDLSIDERDGLIQLFKSYLDVFAWSYKDMPGLDPSIVQHRLPLLPHAKLFRLRLNPKKCTFGVTSGKLLRYMCQRAFERIREYLLSPPILVPPTLSRLLLLYLSVSNVALGCMLAQLNDSGKERSIYYLSKRMLDYETRYVMIERYCLAWVWATWRLRHYMTEYSVHLISRLDPLRYLFDMPALVGRLMRAIDDDFPNEDVVVVTSLLGWCMYFDGAANHSGYRISVLLISLHAQNQFADALETLASMIDIPTEATVRLLLIESRSVLTYYCFIDEAEFDDGLPWYHDIYQFLRLDAYPEAATAKDKRALRQLATRFVICGETLYRRSVDGIMGYRHYWEDFVKSSNGHEFILFAINYFTKWVEAASYARLASSGVASFIISHIICRYGVPHELILDKGVHFRANVNTLLQRYEKLPFALWAYWTSFRTSTEATPYSLVYGMEAVLRVEIEMGSLRVALEQQIPRQIGLKLNLLDERRLMVVDHVRAYQRKMARAFKKRVKSRPL